MARAAINLAEAAFSISPPQRYNFPKVLPPDSVVPLMVDMVARYHSLVQNALGPDDVDVSCEGLSSCCRCLTACFFRGYSWVVQALDNELLALIPRIDSALNGLEPTSSRTIEKISATSKALCDLVSSIQSFLVLRSVLNRSMKRMHPLLPEDHDTQETPVMAALASLNKEAWAVKCQMYQFDDSDSQSCCSSSVRVDYSSVFPQCSVPLETGPDTYQASQVQAMFCLLSLNLLFSQMPK
uniref:Uncharacterized protein n=1 Tax=Moniliophthora roreri TaxID=221103 RepID=A0A0W0FHT7_MONRR